MSSLALPVLRPQWVLLQTNFPDLDQQRMEQVYHMTGGNARELRRSLPVLAVANPQEEDYYAGTLSNRLLPMVPGRSLTKVPMISLPVKALASIADPASPFPLPNSVPST